MCRQSAKAFKTWPGSGSGGVEEPWWRRRRSSRCLVPATSVSGVLEDAWLPRQCLCLYWTSLSETLTRNSKPCNLNLDSSTRNPQPETRKAESRNGECGLPVEWKVDLREGHDARQRQQLPLRLIQYPRP
eukprot:965883-Rhodomonas_salina.2